MTSASSTSAQTAAGRSRARFGTWVSASRSRRTLTRSPCQTRLGAAREIAPSYRGSVTDQTAGGQEPGESVLTVIVAGLANLLIAVAKGAGAFISGSSAMLSEATHSLADTVTEVLLYI